MDQDEAASLKANRRLALMFWGPAVPFIFWIIYLFWTRGAKYEQMIQMRRELDQFFFSPLPLTLWFLYVAGMLVFMFGPQGEHLPKESKTAVSLAISGGILAILLRLLGITSPP